MERKLVRYMYICLVMLLFTGCSSKHEQVGKNGFAWNREESYFIDYSLSENIIKFRYALCFENNTEDDITLSYLNAAFPKSELRGWLRYQKYYPGTLENGDFEITIQAGEKVSIIYVFSGEYLGGSVPDDLSLPDITMLQDHK